MGGGLAGLVSAWVLASHFAGVTLLERDRLPGGASHRRGVPQAPHQHVLLARGRLTLEALFPGLEAEIIAAGAEPLDVAADLGWLTPAGWAPRFRSEITILPCSRVLLEWRVRKRVQANGTVEIRDGHEAVGLVIDEAGSVVGVRARASGRRSLAEEEIRCDLVVDASGRGSRMPRWLEGLGRTKPLESIVDAHISYTSRLYRGSPMLPDGLRGAFIQAAPPAFTRGAAMLPIEDGRTLLTLIGRGGDQPPTDEAGFLEYARTLRSPMVYEAIRQLEPLSPIRLSRATKNVQRHYERLRDWPEGLVVLGDAACAFNPVYGQGMTTAALGAAALGRLLAQEPVGSLLGLGARFQRTLARLNAAPWMFDTDLDLRVHGVTGPSPGRRVRMRQAYLARLGRLGTTSPHMRLAFLEVFHMLRGPRRLLRPRVLVPIALHAGRERAVAALRVSARPRTEAQPNRSPDEPRSAMASGERTEPSARDFERPA